MVTHMCIFSLVALFVDAQVWMPAWYGISLCLSKRVGNKIRENHRGGPEKSTDDNVIGSAN